LAEGIIQREITDRNARVGLLQGLVDRMRKVIEERERNEQSRRYRERVKDRKPPEKEAVPEAARVIPKKFFRRLLQPARLLRMLRALAAIAAATVLLAGVPACDGARLGARAALAKKVCQAPASSWKVAPRTAAVTAPYSEMSLPY